MYTTLANFAEIMRFHNLDHMANFRLTTELSKGVVSDGGLRSFFVNKAVNYHIPAIATPTRNVRSTDGTHLASIAEIPGYKAP